MSQRPPTPIYPPVPVSTAIAVPEPAQPPAQPYPDPIPGIIPFGTVTIFAGAPGVGKTAMLADWIARWRDGKTICGKPTNAPTAFYYIAADRQWASHAQWFERAGVINIPHYSLADDPDFKIDELKNPALAYSHFQRCLAKLNPLRGAHVFIDPVSPLFIGGDPNKSRDVAVSMLWFSRACAQLQINLSLTAHFGKQKAESAEQYTRPQDRIAGSTSFAGFTDTQIYLVDPLPPKQPYHTLGWNPRLAAAEEFHFQRSPDNGLFVPFELFAELDRTEKVLSVVPLDPTRTHLILLEIQKHVGISLQQAERYLAALVKDGRVTKVRRGVYQKAKAN